MATLSKPFVHAVDAAPWPPDVCTATANWQTYHATVVQISGVLTTGFESSLLRSQGCDAVVWVDFGKYLRGKKSQLERSLVNGAQTRVVLEGVFLGPTPVPLDPGILANPKLSEDFKIGLKSMRQTYGHLGCCDYEIYVYNVVEVGRLVPKPSGR